MVGQGDKYISFDCIEGAGGWMDGVVVEGNHSQGGEEECHRGAGEGTEKDPSIVGGGGPGW